jgi:hypothetical protein
MADYYIDDSTIPTTYYRELDGMVNVCTWVSYEGLIWDYVECDLEDKRFYFKGSEADFRDKARRDEVKLARKRAKG